MSIKCKSFLFADFSFVDNFDSCFVDNGVDDSSDSVNPSHYSTYLHQEVENRFSPLSELHSHWRQVVSEPNGRHYLCVYDIRICCKLIHVFFLFAQKLVGSGDYFYIILKNSRNWVFRFLLVLERIQRIKDALLKVFLNLI